MPSKNIYTVEKRIVGGWEEWDCFGHNRRIALKEFRASSYYAHPDFRLVEYQGRVLCAGKGKSDG
jgi:hypothetical protein